MPQIIVHMIANAHIDPVWLWHWQHGSDEAIATCRSVCDILDEYPDATFSRGEAWVYEQVRTLDPVLFARIKKHIAAGRWEVVNGWWVQADTNLPTAEALLKTASLGLEWFREHLGQGDVPVAYLVDSFGHGAYLPCILRQVGQRYFVFMRPGPHEMHLPSSLFRWRSPDGHEVLAYRIPGAYGCNASRLRDHINAALSAPRPPGVEHVMCFYGVGNHGGGPSRQAVEWLRAHRDFAAGVRLEFSTVQRYFTAVEGAADIPTVEGELQRHAIGCYSVCGALKRDIRAAELALADVERLLANAKDAEGHRRELDLAWRDIAFNQFHDVMPGSAVASAVEAARRQVGGARSRAEEVTYRTLRRIFGLARHKPEGHRLLVANRAASEWEGLIDGEIWLDWQRWEHHLEDEEGRPVPVQLLAPEALIFERWNYPTPRLLFPARLAAGECRVFRICEGASQAHLAAKAAAYCENRLENGLLRLDFGPEGVRQITDLQSGEALLARPLFLVAFADGSDTWSHDIDRYAGFTAPLHAIGHFEPPLAVENGPLRAAALLTGRIGGSPCRLIVSLGSGRKAVGFRLETNYQEHMTVLKASIAPVAAVRQRRDRVAGGWVTRAVDGREMPLHHALQVECGLSLGVVLPDSFAADVTPGAIRPTLIRNSVHAYHTSNRVPLDETPELLRRFGTDEGPQIIRWALAFGEDATEGSLERHVARFLQPPWLWDDYCHVPRLPESNG